VNASGFVKALGAETEGSITYDVYTPRPLNNFINNTIFLQSNWTDILLNPKCSFSISVGLLLFGSFSVLAAGADVQCLKIGGEDIANSIYTASTSTFTSNATCRCDNGYKEMPKLIFTKLLCTYVY
jgi:hypothetical protein